MTSISNGQARAHWIDRETAVRTMDPSLTHALACAPERLATFQEDDAAARPDRILTEPTPNA